MKKTTSYLHKVFLITTALSMLSVLTSAQRIAGGNNHSLAICGDNTVRTWGSNLGGQLGDGTNDASFVPVAVNSLTGIIAVSANGEFSLALKNDGTIWAWGYGGDGQIGNGTNTSSNTPVMVNNLTGMIAIEAAGSSCYGLKNDGTVWSWGYNSAGQLGNGTLINSNVPGQVSNLSNVVAISAGAFYAMALKSDGTVWAWGENAWGVLGNGGYDNSSVPVQVGNLSNVIAISGGNYTHALALKSDGTVWAWGLNSNGQLGTGSIVPSTIPTPTQVSNLTNVIAISGANGHSLALKNDGTAWAWGWNAYGQLGNGNNNPSYVPVQVSNLTGIIAIAGGRNQSLAIKNDGTAWGWGDNQIGQLGNGTVSNSNIPVQVPGLCPLIPPISFPAPVIAAGAVNSYFVCSDHTVRQCGLINNVPVNVPVSVNNLTNVIAVKGGAHHALALKSDGTVWAWGANGNGQLGNGVVDPFTNVIVPVQVSNLSGVVAIAAGETFSLALKNDGTVWGWGANGAGQLGDGTYNQSSIPVQANIIGVTFISAGVATSTAVKNDGTVWNWGNNQLQQLGIGSGDENSNVPVPVNTDPTYDTFIPLSGVMAVATGSWHSIALKTDGTVWVWGSDTYEVHGNGPGIGTSSATAVPGLNGIIAVASGLNYCIALKNDGSVWSWGDNFYGQIGNGTSTLVIDVPVQVSNLSNVIAIAAGVRNHTLALKNDNSFWAWGDNTFGQLGIGTEPANNNVPVQVVGPCEITNTFYADNDADGYGDPNNSIQALTPPPGYLVNNEDCNDNPALGGAAVHPGATEVCNGIDDDCDGLIDEGVKLTFYRDADTDGYGNAAITIQACSVPAGYVNNNTDCNDANAAVHPGAIEVCNGIDDDCDGLIDEGVKLTFYRDADADGYGNAAVTTQACSVPAGYVNNNTDCNDANAAVNPGATEICNGIDDDCDGLIDEGVKSTFYRDADTDGYGNASITTQACSAPAGYVNNSTDCNDANAAVNPGATEICNGIDDDCDGLIDEGVKSTFYRDADTDGYGNAAVTTQACTVPAGYVNNNTDCNDANAAVHPGATEICNGIDDDCDGLIDEGVKSTFYRDADTDGYGNAAVTTQACTVPAGYVNNNTDCNDANAAVHPGATEVCNGIDDDCDGLIDEGVKLTFYRDADTDGYGNAAVTTQACTVPAGYVNNNTDCNDANAAVHPGATEVCNGIDDDCDGESDEGCALVPQSILWIGNGATLRTTGDIQVVLNNMNLINDGSLLQEANHGRFKFTGITTSKISGAAIPLFSSLEIAKTGGAELQLFNNISLATSVIFSSGNINLNANTILLQPTAMLIGEKETSRVVGNTGGYVTITQTLNSPASVNPGNLGAIFSSPKNFGSTVIRRGHQVQSLGGVNSLQRYFDITPSNNSNLNAALRFGYFDAELNGISENSVVLWKFADNVNWTEIGSDNKNTSLNYVEKTGIDDFSRWTLANRSMNINDVVVYESQGTAILTITLSAPAITPLKLRYSTIDGTAVSTGKNKDFKAASNGSITIPAGSTTGNISIAINEDNLVEQSEYFDVEVAGITTVTGRVTILDGVSPGITHISPLANESEKFNIRVYPNPSEKDFLVRMDGAKNSIAILTLSDITGRVIRKMEANNIGTTRLGTDLKQGIYFLEVMYEGTRRIIKLVKL